MPAGLFCTSIDILTSWVHREEGWLHVWCYSYRGAMTSDISADPPSDIPACTVQLYQTCMLGSFIQIHVFVKCFSTRQEIWYVTNPPDMPTGKVRLPRNCITYQLPAWTPSWIFKFSVMHQLHHWDVTMMMSVTQESVKPAFCMQFPGVCQSQGKFPYIFVINCHFGGHFVCILILFSYFC